MVHRPAPPPAEPEPVADVIDGYGRPEGFDAAGWLAAWLEQPLAALAGRCPSSLMDTPEGQALVSGLLSRLQTGAYA